MYVWGQHLHLGLSFPAMKAPAFRCDKVQEKGGSRFRESRGGGEGWEKAGGGGRKARGGKGCFEGNREQHLYASRAGSSRLQLLITPPLPPPSGHLRIRRTALLQQPAGSVAHRGGQREEGDRGCLGLCRRGKVCFCVAVSPERILIPDVLSCTAVPLQVGVLKGVAKEYFKFQITIDLLQARGVDEGADHEVWGGCVDLGEYEEYLGEGKQHMCEDGGIPC